MPDYLKFALLLCLLLGGQSVWASESPAATESHSATVATEQGNSSVIQAFTSREIVESDIVVIEDKTKRLIMFLLAVPLLLLLIATVALGVAMGIYGKQVFLPHMICAGLSLTLALGHAVVGIVWFFPF
ncbi:MAG: hypothetical protein GXP17_03335 [Gammaproteobacteria bacterium]|nr:hypothetical protein [Gammaproteobacteria bacterium]